MGGETSGHLLCLDKTTTGDGLISALQVLSVMAATGRPLAELVAPMSRLPQILINVRTARRLDLEAPEFRTAVADAEQLLGRRGRILVRASGTEPVIRVMVEGEDEGEVVNIASSLAGEIESLAAA